MTVHVCGIDIGKTVFHLVGLSKEGHIVQKKRFSRKQLLTYMVNTPACLVGIEVCPGAHFLARALVAQGHSVKLMPAEYVSPHAGKWCEVYPCKGRELRWGIWQTYESKPWKQVQSGSWSVFMSQEGKSARRGGL